MSLQVYILKCGEPFSLLFPPNVEQEIKSYTNGQPYINVIISEQVTIKLDDMAKIFFNDPSNNVSNVKRINTRESIESICDSIGIETIFYEISEDNNEKKTD